MASRFVPRDFKLRVRKAATGRGLFAEERIPKGACIIEYIGRPATLEEVARDDGKYLFWTGTATMINGNIPENLARYINHSCVPNCEADGPRGRVFILARRAIKPGEELTYDYGEEYFDKHIRPGGCLCIKCASSNRHATIGRMGARISPIQRKKSKSRKTKKRLAVKAAMLAARAAKKTKRSKRR